MSDEYFSAQPETAASAGNPAPVWELSGWWRRVGASLVDGLIIWIPLTIIYSLIVGVGGESGDSNAYEGGRWLIGLLASSAYFMATMSAWNGQTIGKRVTAIRVVRENGESVDAKFAFVRQILVISILFNTIGALFLLIPMILNYLWPLWDDKNQALHDKVVKSRVVREQPSTDPGSVQAAQQQEQAPFPVATPPAPHTPAAPASTPIPPVPTVPPPPPPPPPSGTSTPYAPPSGFENPVPEDEK